MMRRLVTLILVVSGLLLAACGPAIVPAAAPQTESGEVFLVALPRIVVSFDADGKPGLEGVALEEIASSLGMALDLSAYRIHPFYPGWMTAANIQHIELRQTGDGIAVLINGALMPSLSFQDGALERVADVAPLLGEQGAALKDLIQKFAPLVRRLGLSVVLKFPLQDGAEPLPYAEANVKLAVMEPMKEAPSAIIQFEIRYDADGVPSILGISARDLAALNIQAPLALAPEYLQMLQANNVQHMQARSKGDGLYLFVNGTPLPNIMWDEGTLQQAIEVYAQMNPGIPPEYMDLIRTFVPMLARTDLSIMIHFPLAPGAEPIPAKMQ